MKTFNNFIAAIFLFVMSTFTTFAVADVEPSTYTSSMMDVEILTKPDAKSIAEEEKLILLGKQQQQDAALAEALNTTQDVPVNPQSLPPVVPEKEITGPAQVSPTIFKQQPNRLELSVEQMQFTHDSMYTVDYPVDGTVEIDNDLTAEMTVLVGRYSSQRSEQHKLYGEFKFSMSGDVDFEVGNSSLISDPEYYAVMFGYQHKLDADWNIGGDIEVSSLDTEYIYSGTQQTFKDQIKAVSFRGYANYHYRQNALEFEARAGIILTNYEYESAVFGGSNPDHKATVEAINAGAFVEASATYHFDNNWAVVANAGYMTQEEFSGDSISITGDNNASFGSLKHEETTIGLGVVYSF